MSNTFYALTVVFVSDDWVNAWSALECCCFHFWNKFSCKLVDVFSGCLKATLWQTLAGWTGRQFNNGAATKKQLLDEKDLIRIFSFIFAPLRVLRVEIKLCLLLADMKELIDNTMSVRVVCDNPRQSSSRPRNREKLSKNLRRALLF